MELHNEGANPEDANAVIVLVEFELLAQIQDDLLSCDNPKLQKDSGCSYLRLISSGSRANAGARGNNAARFSKTSGTPDTAKMPSPCSPYALEISLVKSFPETRSEYFKQTISVNLSALFTFF